ncbi:ABC transporter substrate-binding protein [Virgibacillus profundi]|uniref:ABC transporter substrate-binding protein n=1 Tax=Virgibacillus profundi TaxID=2024555 RepID=A0A2A2IJB0_9BACI|nr:extracellular solute-binding protein [Virgibacillus profundi]PAV31193.1 ABC transporter substrate-binding protein [Virgibacillus profundi]PXY55375.1 ABC transporter substrate-binding protein [Virgibacillus profundi]
MKKGLFLWLTALITIVMLAACSSDEESKETDSSADVKVNEEGYPIVDEKLEMTLMAPDAGVAEWGEMPVLQEYAEKTNIHFEYNLTPISDFGTKLNLAFASGDLPDIIFAAGSNDFTSAMEMDYGKQGLLLPLEDLIKEYAPNIQKVLEERPEIRKSITTPDGHIYALPRVTSGNHEAVWYRQPLWYNGQWLDALGVEEPPKTTEEFYDLLVRFKTEDPNGNGEADEIPLSDVNMNGSRQWLLNAFGMKVWDIEEVDGKVRYAPITENYKEYLTFMKKLYNEKLLDQETFSQSNDQFAAKGQNNRLGVFNAYYSFQITGETEEEAMNNPMYFPLKSSVSNEPLMPLNPGMSRGSFSITKDNPSPEASIRWVDYLYSPEGHAYFDQGPEGLLWEWDENKEVRLDLPVPEKFDNREKWRSTITPAYGILLPELYGPIEGQKETDFYKFIQSETAEKYEPYAEIPFPLIYLESEEQDEINTIKVDLQSYVEQMEAKFITGVEPLSNWDGYVKTIESMGIDRYVEIYQEAYDKWSEG